MGKGLVDKKTKVHFEPDNGDIVEQFPSMIRRLTSLIDNQSKRGASV